MLRAYPRFARVWAATAVSNTGAAISRFALLLYVARQFDSPLPVVMLLAVETLPALVASPVAGLTADRLRRTRVMVGADAARMILMAVVLVRPSFVMVLIAAALHAIATAFYLPARASVVRQLVPADTLMAANAVEQAAGNVILIAGPALGAELFVRYGLEITLVVDCVLYAVSGLLTLTVAVPRCEPGTGTLRRPLDDIVAGWRYLWMDPVTPRLCAVFFVGLLCAAVWTPLAPFFVRDYLGGGERILSYQFALFGAGAVTASLLAPRLARAIGRGELLFAGIVAEALAQTAYAAAGHPVISTAVMFGWGVSVSCIVVPFYAILQSVIDDRFLGRTFAVVRQAEGVATVGAIGLTAVLVTWFDSRAILLAGGLAYCSIAALTWLKVRSHVLAALR